MQPVCLRSLVRLEIMAKTYRHYNFTKIYMLFSTTKYVDIIKNFFLLKTKEQLYLFAKCSIDAKLILKPFVGNFPPTPLRRSKMDAKKTTP